MCSRLLQKMENYQGDLTDILRASSGTAPAGEVSASMITDEWQFPSNAKDFLPMADQETLDEFGDPFSNIRDPLLHELDMPSSGFFTSSTSTSSDMVRPGSFAGGCGNTMLVTQRITEEEIIKRQTCNNDSSNNNTSIIFSTMLQIPPNAKLPVSPRDSSQVVVTAPSPLGSNELVSSSAAPVGNSKGSLVENGGAQQISSPRNTGMKRRKSQAKKVVCIPAPAPANSRPSGEIVPSDLWAWRKYGQKPIKGSPYPRGYYRCSSSKGCSARKQVERSRTDPNMLVITYTSEHNHPWPTQRNALAGSTRTQPTKTASTSKATQTQKSFTNLKEEENQESAIDNASSPAVTPSSSTCPSMKEETDNDHDKQAEMDHHDVHFNEVFQQTYRPALPDSNHAEDFFADLGELEADPLNLLFPQGYSGDEEPETKSLDPFNFYDWVNNTTAAATATAVTASVEEVNKGL